MKALATAYIVREAFDRTLLRANWTAYAHFVAHVFQPAKFHPHTLQNQSQFTKDITANGKINIITSTVNDDFDRRGMAEKSKGRSLIRKDEKQSKIMEQLRV